MNGMDTVFKRKRKKKFLIKYLTIEKFSGILLTTILSFHCIRSYGNILNRKKCYYVQSLATLKNHLIAQLHTASSIKRLRAILHIFGYKKFL